VSLPEVKHIKYLAKLDPWIEGVSVTRKATEDIVGTLNHCTYVVPPGRSHLVSLYCLTALFNWMHSPCVKLKVEQDIARDIDWW
jgi:hypothetical protein